MSKILKNVQKCNRGKNYNVLFKKLVEIPLISHNKWNKWNSCVFHCPFLLWKCSIAHAFLAYFCVLHLCLVSVFLVGEI